MFYRRSGGGFVLKLFLLLFGLRFLDRKSHAECDHTEFRARRRAFRKKIREAFDVFDDESETVAQPVHASHEATEL
ncbi:hypothetical protein [Sulfoacidibacillus ferrooxidans]|uniref:Uncharacterized protein n=1 Tax=Sulfoacidibacillus ferrooxidans TaxID=2005001 RepID=A0A9X1V6N1_9BACL|nr:hypothetical protein [Sulfoacidibacillus ferrooxidans]MCI0182147.1 hypothetical protein [Sulfoacidibacillus ferrooxidans]